MSGCTCRIVSGTLHTIPQLWFDDGDIVIQANNPAKHGIIRGYKLHRGVIAVHAPVFMEFLDENLARQNDAFDNTPAVFVPESAWDLDPLLYALYHPSSLLRWKYRPTTFQRTLPLYKIAMKYKIDHITDVLSAQLEQDWPKMLWEWDAFESDDELYIKRGADIYFDLYPEPVAAINFARIAKLESILPAAFYQLSRVKATDDYDRNIAPDTVGSDCRSARWSQLSKEDFLCLAAGKDRLTEMFASIHTGLAMELQYWESHAQCQKAWTLMPPLQPRDILQALKEVCKADELPGAFMCDGCRSRVNVRARKEREAIWEKLPQLFRLPETCETF